MKKVFLKKKIILSIVLVFLGMMGKGQNLPPNDTIKFNVSELSSPDANFKDVYKRANAYYAIHPEADSLNPLEKDAYRRWEHFWKDRAYISGVAEPGKLKYVLKAMSDTNELKFKTEALSQSIAGKWNLISPDEFETQNLGVVTAIWAAPDFSILLIGTEKSGLWKSTNGGLNWINITDSYVMPNNDYTTAAGFGISSIAVDPSNINRIYISCFSQTADLVLGNGRNILRSNDGGVTWSMLPSYKNYLEANQIDFSTNVWKIKLDPAKYPAQQYDSLLLYAAIGNRLVVLRTSNSLPSYKVIFEIGTDNPVPNNGNPWQFSYFKRRIRDFEIILNGSVRTMCLSTDGYRTYDSQNNTIVNLNAELYYTNYSTHPIFIPTWYWTRKDLNTSPDFYVDNAAIVIDDINIQPSFYIAWYKKADFNYGIFNISHLNITTNNLATYLNVNYGDINRYSELADANYNNLPFAGFGYRYDAFEKVTGSETFFVGGFDITKIQRVIDPPNDYFDFSLITYNQQAISSGDYQNQNYNKNKYCHNGIRTLSYSEKFKTLLIGNEGGISKYSNNNLQNLNGKGLAINSFTNLATTRYNNRDVVTASSFRNGIWHYEKGFNSNKWRQFYWEDGGTLLLNDQNPDNIFNIKSSVLNLTPSAWGNQVFKTNNSLSFVNQSNLLSHNPANVLPSLNLNSNFSEGGLGEGPLEFSPVSNQTLYNGRHNVWETTNGGTTWNNISSPNFEFPYWCGLLRTLKVAPSNQNVIYTAFDIPTWGLDVNGNECYTNPSPPQLPVVIPCTPGKKLWRGDKIGNVWQWTDLTVNVTNSLNGEFVFAWTNVTDIAINPSNAQELWISLGQFSKLNASQGKWRVLHSTDGGMHWSEYSKGLSPAPVNCIKYYTYSGKNLLFVGTDVGVYYRDPSDNSNTAQWQQFNSTSNPLPMCIVTDIEFYYPDNKIRVSTYGRGLWEAEIPCIADNISQFTEIKNGENIVWSDVKYKADVVVKSGGILTINGTVHFQQNTTLTVEPGGKLIIDGGTLTDICNKMWNGVVVQGYWNEPQSNTIKHGIIELINNGTISNAIIGVELIDPYMTGGPAYGAGIIKAKNSNFINNQKAVAMHRYDYNNSPVSRPVENISYFRYCSFTTDNAYHDATNYQFKRFIEFNQIRGAKVQACSFTNSCSSGNINFGVGEGIYSNSSKFTVEGYCNAILPQGYTCPSQNVDRSSFTNLKYGINAIGSATTPFTAKQSDFFDNCNAIYANNITSACLTENNVRIPLHWLQSFPKPYGFYLEGCNKFIFEGNNFFGNAPNNGYYGTIINNSGSNTNLVYNNTYSNLRYGINVYGNNRGSNELTGLKLKCNDNTNNYMDFWVKDQGISKYQGSPTLNNNPPMATQNINTIPAGNTFSKHTSPTGSDFYNNGQFIWYYHHLTNTCIPTNNIGSITLFNVNNSTYLKSLSCPPNYLNISQGSSVIVANISALQQNINSTKLILCIWVDGGNTDALKQAVDLAYPWEAYELYNNLISKSPYLSDEVLIKAIENEEVLPPALLKLVLLANPQAVRSEKVWDALRNRHNPLPDYMIDEIKQGCENISPKEQLEAELSYWIQEKSLAENNLMQLYMQDTIPENAFAGIISYMQTQNTLSAATQELLLYTDINDEDHIDSLLLAIPQQYTMDEKETEEWNLLNNYIEIIRSIKTQNISPAEISTEQKNELYNILEKSQDIAYNSSLALLILADTSLHYQEPLYEPDTTLERRAIIKKPKTNEEKHLKVYPNPAKFFFSVEYDLSDSELPLILKITDISGKTIEERQLKNKRDIIAINCTQYSKGNYNCIIFAGQKIKQMAKFVIE